MEKSQLIRGNAWLWLACEDVGKSLNLLLIWLKQTMSSAYWLSHLPTCTDCEEHSYKPELPLGPQWLLLLPAMANQSYCCHSCVLIIWWKQQWCDLRIKCWSKSCMSDSPLHWQRTESLVPLSLHWLLSYSSHHRRVCLHHNPAGWKRHRFRHSVRTAARTYTVLQ